MVLKGSFPEVLRRCKPGLAACKTRTFNFILPPPQRQDSLFSSGLMRFLCNLLPHCTVSHSVGLSFVIRVLVSITLRLSSGGKKRPPQFTQFGFNSSLYSPLLSWNAAVCLTLDDISYMFQWWIYLSVYPFMSQKAPDTSSNLPTICPFLFVLFYLFLFLFLGLTW